MIIIQRIQDIKFFIVENSCFSEMTISNVIRALGFPPKGSGEPFKELSNHLEKCAEGGADNNFPGFSNFYDTITFFIANRQDIVKHMELYAVEIGTDIISMVQGFGVLRNSEKPTPSEVGRALWDSGNTYPELYKLYNVFAWYALEEVSHTWLRYLESHQFYRAELST